MNLCALIQCYVSQRQIKPQYTQGIWKAQGNCKTTFMEGEIIYNGTSVS